MLTPLQLETLVADRIVDAETLIANGRYGAALYICGYAVELALKRRICLTLAWPGFPETSAEFKLTGNLKVHDFPTLVQFTGRQSQFTLANNEWATVLAWSPENRYKPPGAATMTSATLMLQAVQAVVAQL